MKKISSKLSPQYLKMSRLRTDKTFVDFSDTSSMLSSNISAVVAITLMEVMEGFRKVDEISPSITWLENIPI
jgi:hypothetical protein